MTHDTEPTPPADADAIAAIHSRLKEWDTAPFAEEEYTAYGRRPPRINDIRILLEILDAATSRAEAAERSAVKQESTIHLMGRYLNDEDWITLNKIRDTPGWEQHVNEFDLDTGKIDPGLVERDGSDGGA